MPRQGGFGQILPRLQPQIPQHLDSPSPSLIAKPHCIRNEAPVRHTQVDRLRRVCAFCRERLLGSFVYRGAGILPAMQHHALPSPKQQPPDPANTKDFVTILRLENLITLSTTVSISNKPITHHPTPIQPKCATRTAVPAAQPATNPLLTTAATALPNTPPPRRPLFSMMVSRPMLPSSTRSHQHQLYCLSLCNHTVGVTATEDADIEDAIAVDRFISWSAWSSARFRRRRREGDWRPV